MAARSVSRAPRAKARPLRSRCPNGSRTVTSSRSPTSLRKKGLERAAQIQAALSGTEALRHDDVKGDRTGETETRRVRRVPGDEARLARRFGTTNRSAALPALCEGRSRLTRVAGAAAAALAPVRRGS